MSLVLTLGLAGLLLSALLGFGEGVPVGQAASPPPRYLSTGDGSWFWQNPLPQGNTLYGINCPAPTLCFAVGDNGLIIATTDGVNWGPQPLPPNLTVSLRAVSCPTTQICYAVGKHGTIVAAVHSPWYVQPSSTIEDLYGISCPSPTLCFAVGGGGTIIATTDGVNWAPQPNLPPALAGTTLRGIACPSTQICYAVGNLGMIVAAVNSPWTIQTSNAFNKNLFGIACPGTTHCYAVGDSGVLDELTQIGWVIRSSSTSTLLYGLSCPDNVNCFAVSVSGVIVASVNYAPWWFQTSPTKLDLYGLSCPAGTTRCYAVGYGGVIVTTTNNGSDWDESSYSATLKDLHAVSCLNSLVCLAVGNGGAVVEYFSVANNENWFPLTSNTTQDLKGIGCPDPSRCYAVGNNGEIVATINNSPWTKQTTNTLENLYGFSCLPAPASSCFAVGTGGLILGSINGGPWLPRQVPAGFSTTLRSVSCDTGLCLAVGDGGTVLVSFPNGAWDLLPSPTNKNLRSITCSATSICHVAGDSGTLLVVNSQFVGAPQSGWVTQSSGTNQDLLSISCRPGNAACYAVGNSGTIISTTDGTNWKPQKSGTIMGLGSISCLVRCVSVGTRGAILANAQVVTNPLDYDANNTSTLTYAINRAGPNQAIMFDVPGNKISLDNPLPQLLDGVKLIGSCSNNGPQVVIDASGTLVGSVGLSQNNTLYGIRLQHFFGPTLKVAAPYQGGNTHLQCTAVQH